MDNKVKMSSAITGGGNADDEADMGQDGNYAGSRLPIKNRINAIDVSR